MIAEPFKQIDFIDGKSQFDGLVKHYHNLLWYKSILCPCRKEVTTQPQHDCINCDGKGYIYFDSKEIQGVLSSMAIRKNFINWTENLTGTAQFSTVAENKLGYLDKIVVKDGYSLYSETLNSTAEVVSTTTKKVLRLNYSFIKFVKIYEFIDTQTELNELVLGTDIFPHPTNPNKVYCNNTNGRYDKISFLYTYNTTYAVLDILNDWRNFHQQETLKGNNELGIESERLLLEYPIRVILKQFHLIET